MKRAVTTWSWSEWGVNIQVEFGERDRLDLFLPGQDLALLLPDGRYLELPQKGTAKLELELDPLVVNRSISSRVLDRFPHTRILGPRTDPWVEVFSPFPEGPSLRSRAESLQLRIRWGEAVEERDIVTLGSLLMLPRHAIAALEAATWRQLGLEPEDPDRAFWAYLSTFLGRLPAPALTVDLRKRIGLAAVAEEAYRRIVLKEVSG